MSTKKNRFLTLYNRFTRKLLPGIFKQTAKSPTFTTLGAIKPGTLKASSPRLSGRTSSSRTSSSRISLPRQLSSRPSPRTLRRVAVNDFFKALRRYIRAFNFYLRTSIVKERKKQ